MPLTVFDFLHLSLTDALDILLVGLIIFLVFRWIRESSALNIFLAILLIYVAKLLVDAFNMKLMGYILGTFIDVGVIAIIVIFQPEIRHFLMKIGSGTGLSSRWRGILDKLFGYGSVMMEGSTVNEITEACRAMSQDKTGALIVIPHNVPIDDIISTGDKIDAAVSRRLIMNLFFKNSPLHDGAVIISGDRIVAARCTLPITSRTDIPPSYGMRHKAAIGISEVSDADVVVVSEETGKVSFIKEGHLTQIGNLNELKLLLSAALTGPANEKMV